MTTYWAYDKDSKIFTGPVEADEQPENSSPFPPPESEGYVSVFDGIGWRTIPDLTYRGRSLEEAKALLQSMVDSAPAGRDFKYSPVERASFDAKYREAVAYLEDSSVKTTYLAAVSSATGESIEDLALKVVEKHDAWHAKEAVRAAKAEVLRNQIANAKSVEDLPSWSEISSI